MIGAEKVKVRKRLLLGPSFLLSVYNKSYMVEQLTFVPESFRYKIIAKKWVKHMKITIMVKWKSPQF